MSMATGAARAEHPVGAGRSALGDLRTVGVTAGRHGEGATAIAVDLARALAAAEARVLVAECNLRTPSLTAVLGMRARPGLAEFLNGEVRVTALVRASPTANLFLVGAGTRPAVVDTRAIADVVAELAPRFDHVVLDLPPIDAYPDTEDLAPAVDGVILVVDPAKTPIGDAERFATRLREVGARLFGVVLNPRSTSDPKNPSSGHQQRSGTVAAAGRA
jgi:Mrp family chromosome partitioning ATPase